MCVDFLELLLCVIGHTHLADSFFGVVLATSV